jgi:hypothetical protein
VAVGTAHYAQRREPEREHEHTASSSGGWTFYAGEEEPANPVAASAAARSMKPPTRTITNQDVQQVNQNNGIVKYDGKSEQIK